MPTWNALLARPVVVVGVAHAYLSIEYPWFCLIHSNRRANLGGPFIVYINQLLRLSWRIEHGAEHANRVAKCKVLRFLIFAWACNRTRRRRTRSYREAPWEVCHFVAGKKLHRCRMYHRNFALTLHSSRVYRSEFDAPEADVFVTNSDIPFSPQIFDNPAN